LSVRVKPSTVTGTCHAIADERGAGAHRHAAAALLLRTMIERLDGRAPPP
jgi:hypothetical protein